MNDHEQDNTERDVARLLEAAGARETLPEELRARWEAHFRAELAAARPGRRRRLILTVGALAACIVVLLLSLNRFVIDPSPSVLTRVQAIAGTGSVSIGGKHSTAAVPGSELSAGAVVESDADSRIALTWAGYDLRLNQNTRLILGRDRVELAAGEIYISDRGLRTSLDYALVVTPFGTVRDVGTQFKVRIAQDSVSTSVRRGSILVEAGGVEHRADAEPGSAKTLTLYPDQRAYVADDDSDWSWIYPVAGPFELEGSTVLDFLHWSTTESGLELHFADEDVALAAGNTRLSGSIDISSLDPGQGVKLVLSTTRFTARQEEGRIQVSRRSE